MKYAIVIVALAATLSGCATPPSTILPADVSASQYAKLSCDELLRRLYAANDAYAPLAMAQQKTSTYDEVGVFWIGLPVGSADLGDASNEMTAHFEGRRDEAWSASDFSTSFKPR